jgi:hypothetical protein
MVIKAHRAATERARDAPGPWATSAAARAAASLTARANSVSCVNPGAAAGSGACGAAASPCCWWGGAASEAGASKPLRRTRLPASPLPSSLSRDRDLLLSRPPLRHRGNKDRRGVRRGVERWRQASRCETLGALCHPTAQQAQACAAAHAAVDTRVPPCVVASAAHCALEQKRLSTHLGSPSSWCRLSASSCWRLWEVLMCTGYARDAGQARRGEVCLTLSPRHRQPGPGTRRGAAAPPDM